MELEGRTRLMSPVLYVTHKQRIKDTSMFGELKERGDYQERLVNKLKGSST